MWNFYDSLSIPWRYKIGLFLIRPKNGGSCPTPRILTLIINQFYLIIGSKNVHLIIGKPGDLEFYKESRFHVSQILIRIKSLLFFCNHCKQDCKGPLAMFTHKEISAKRDYLFLSN